MSRQTGLPRFTAQQQVGGQPVADTSGAARSLTQLGQRVQQFGQQQLVRGAVTKATQDGEMAGLDPNFRPSSFPGAATQAFNKAALASNRTLMGTDIILNSQRLRSEAVQSSPDAAVQLQNFNKAASEYSSQTINQSPEANRAYTQNMLNFHVGTAHNAMLHGLHQQQQIKASAQWLQSDNVFHDDTLQAVNNIDFNQEPEEVAQGVAAAGALLSQRNASTKLAAEGHLISPSMRDNQISDNKVEFNQELITSQFRSKLREGGDAPAKFIQKISDASLQGPTAGSLKGMNATHRKKLAGLLLSEQHTFLNSQGINKAEVNRKAKSEIARVADGGTPDKSIRAIVAAQTPGNLDNYDNRIDISQQTRSMFLGAEQLSFDNQKKFFAQAVPKDANSKDFEKNKKIIEGAQGKIDQQNHQIGQIGAAEFFQDNPAVTDAINRKAAELNSGVNFKVMQSNGIKPLSPDPISRIVTAQLMKGIPFSKVEVATKEQGDKISSLLKSKAPTTDKVNALRSLQATYGRWYPQLMGQLTSENKVSSNETFLGALSPTDPDLPVIDQALNTQRSVLESNIGEDRLKQLKAAMGSSLDGKTSRSTIFPGFTKTQKFNRKLSDFEDSYLAFSPNGTAKFLDNTKQFMNNVALSIMTQDTSISGSDAWLKASDKIAGKFNYTTLNGKTQRVPLQFSQDVVSKYAKAQEKKLKDFPFVLSRSSNGQMLTRDKELKMNVKTGGYVTSPNNDGMQWVRVDGALLRDNKGNPFEFKFRDAMSNAQENHTESNSKFGDFQKPTESEIKAQELLAKMATAKFPKIPPVISVTRANKK